jgi:hypothetical protein
VAYKSTGLGNGVSVTVTFGPELRSIANAMRTIDATLPTKLRAQLRKDAKPLVNKAKAAARAIPVHQGDKKNLRRTIAKGIRVQASTGKRAQVRVVTSMPDASEAIIPRGLDSPKGWRHPVFGSDTWVNQTAMEPNHWFFTAMQEGREAVDVGITKTIKEALELIAANGIKI